jgi:hypothetical protein
VSSPPAGALRVASGGPEDSPLRRAFRVTLGPRRV